MVCFRCGLAFLCALIAMAGGAEARAQAIDAPDDTARLIAAAGRGEPQAALAVADAYRLGRGVAADYLAAEGWYVRAAQAGSVRAATELGLLYIDRSQPVTALPWLDRAARKGDPRAIGALATLYVNGNGIAPDRPLAYALTARSAASGLAAAQAQLALLKTYLTPAEIDAGADRLRRWDAETPAPLPLAQAVAPAATPAPPAWQVQIGAFGSIGKARAGWDILSDRLRFDPGLTPLLIPAGPIVRLRLPAGDGDAARGLCRRIRAAGVDCVAFHSEAGAPAAALAP
jgi:cell division septation protein DedD